MQVSWNKCLGCFLLFKKYLLFHRSVQIFKHEIHEEYCDSDYKGNIELILYSNQCKSNIIFTVIQIKFKYFTFKFKL